MLETEKTWDGFLGSEARAAYDAQAKKLAKLFSENDAKFEMSEAVRKAGPRG